MATSDLLSGRSKNFAPANNSLFLLVKEEISNWGLVSRVLPI